jgi:hypothetical protein
MELTRKQSEKGLDGLQLHRLCPVLARRAAKPAGWASFWRLQ